MLRAVGTFLAEYRQTLSPDVSSDIFPAAYSTNVVLEIIRRVFFSYMMTMARRQWPGTAALYPGVGGECLTSAGRRRVCTYCTNSAAIARFQAEVYTCRLLGEDSIRGRHSVDSGRGGLDDFGLMTTHSPEIVDFIRLSKHNRRFFRTPYFVSIMPIRPFSPSSFLLT